ncbi:uncharacterized protein LOC144873933 isoform X2 [Branchiostoma floridae x Branchiostoma japonicum]
MTKPMSLVWLIAIGLLALSFADVTAGTFEKKESEDDVGKGASKETSGAGIAELQNWKDKIDAIRALVNIIADGSELYSRMSAKYEMVEKGEMSKGEFVRDMVRRAFLIFGKAGGKAVGSLVIPVGGIGKVIGEHVGERLGKVLGIFLAGEAADDVEKALIPLEGDDKGMHVLRCLGELLGALGRALDVVVQFFPRASASYEQWQNGEISTVSFSGKLGKDVVRVGSTAAGTVVGASLGAWYIGPALGQLAIPIPGLGAAMGAYVGNWLGGKVGDFVTG